MWPCYRPRWGRYARRRVYLRYAAPSSSSPMGGHCRPYGSLVLRAATQGRPYSPMATPYGSLVLRAATRGRPYSPMAAPYGSPSRLSAIRRAKDVSRHVSTFFRATTWGRPIAYALMAHTARCALFRNRRLAFQMDLFVPFAALLGMPIGCEHKYAQKNHGHRDPYNI